MKRTACPELTAAESVRVTLVPEMEIDAIVAVADATDTPNALLSSPDAARLSSKLRLICVGVDVLTFPER